MGIRLVGRVVGLGFILACLFFSGLVFGGETLRVLSYNIHMWEPSVKDLTGVIKAADPDIVGLNEAWTEKKNAEIAKALGYNIVCGGMGKPTSGKKRSHSVNDYYMPQVLLTRHKIVESRVFNAMAVKDWEHKPDFDPNDMPIYRGGTLALLETKQGNRVAVFVLHLHPWGGTNERMTEMRLNEIKGIVKKLKPYADLPVLIIGDFNTRSHLDGIKGWKVSRYLDKQGFKDLYRMVYPDAKGSPGKTAPEGRIDYIFFNKHVKPVGSKVVTDGVFGSKGFGHSDHLAVFGEVKIDSADRTEVNKK